MQDQICTLAFRSQCPFLFSMKSMGSRRNPRTVLGVSTTYESGKTLLHTACCGKLCTPRILRRLSRSCHPRVTEWTTTIQTHLPHWTKPQATVLARWSLGMVLARSCALTAVSAFLAPWLHRT